MWKRLSFSSPASASQAPPKSVIQGSCDCGDINVRVNSHSFHDRAAFARICHCIRCRKASGSHYAHNIELPVSDVVIEGSPDGHLVAFTEPSSMLGKLNYRWHCGRCGCPIAGKDAEDSATISVRVGFFATEVRWPPRSELLKWQKVEWLKGKLEGLEEDVGMEGWNWRLERKDESWS